MNTILTATWTSISGQEGVTGSGFFLLREKVNTGFQVVRHQAMKDGDP